LNSFKEFWFMFLNNLISLTKIATSDPTVVIITINEKYVDISDTIFSLYLKSKMFIKLLSIKGVNWEFKKLIE
jgi:hypothetical protein